MYRPPDTDVLWPLSGPSLRAQMQQLVVAERSEPGPRLGEAGPGLVMRGRWGEGGHGLMEDGCNLGCKDCLVSTFQITKRTFSINFLVKRESILRLETHVKITDGDIQTLRFSSNCEHFSSLGSHSLLL